MGLPGLTDRAPLDHASAMNQEHLSAVLATANVQPDKDGWATLEGDRTLTLYVANQGVSLNISRIEALRKKQIARATLNARTAFAKQDLAGAIRGWDTVLQLDPDNELAKLERQKAVTLKAKADQLK